MPASVSSRETHVAVQLGSWELQAGYIHKGFNSWFLRQNMTSAYSTAMWQMLNRFEQLRELEEVLELHLADRVIDGKRHRILGIDAASDAVEYEFLRAWFGQKTGLTSEVIEIDKREISRIKVLPKDIDMAFYLNPVMNRMYAREVREVFDALKNPLVAGGVVFVTNRGMSPNQDVGRFLKDLDYKVLYSGERAFMARDRYSYVTLAQHLEKPL